MDRDIIINDGIIGCSIARELSRYDLKITVIEKELNRFHVSYLN